MQEAKEILSGYEEYKEFIKKMEEREQIYWDGLCIDENMEEEKSKNRALCEIMHHIIPIKKSEIAKEFFDLLNKINGESERLFIMLCYEVGIGTEKDEEKSLNLRIEHANEGNHYSQSTIGDYYKDKDKKVALEWYKKSAIQGNKRCFEKTWYIYSDYKELFDEGLDFYKSMLNNEKIKENVYWYIGELYEKKKESSIAIEWYKKGIMEGHDNLKIKIGDIYRHKQKYHEALKWYKSCKNWNWSTKYAITTAYKDIAFDYGLNGNYNEAIKWNKKSLEYDEESVMGYTMGELYRKKGDLLEAKIWYDWGEFAWHNEPALIKKIRKKYDNKRIVITELEKDWGWLYGKSIYVPMNHIEILNEIYKGSEREWYIIEKVKMVREKIKEELNKELKYEFMSYIVSEYYL